MSLSVGKQAGPYQILAPLGAGGMGEVFRARDTRLGRDVAVKVISEALASDPERLRRFEHEARAASMLNHPNILAIHDVGSHEGAPYVVSELLEGETLGERLKGGRLPLRKAVDIALQIGHGLAAAHDKGIVHRDLKPDNLFLTRDGHVKILDFGLAKLVRPELERGGPGAHSGSLTESGTILGTAGYMAPEQVRGERADHRADLFAFGAILYEMLSGQRAFPGTTYVDSMHSILNLEPAPLAELRREVPTALEEFVRHCLEKDPAQRFQSARDATFALQAFRGEERGSRTLATSRGQRSMRAALATAAAALLVGAGLGALLHQRMARAPIPEFQRLTFRRGYVAAARFSSDGHTIIYNAAWQGRQREIFSTLPEQPESRALGYRDIELLSVSSAGEMAIKLPNGTLARVPLAGGTPREMLENIGGADWAPNGADLAVTRVVGGKFRIEYPIGETIFESATVTSHPRVSRDGNWVAFRDHSVPGDEGAAVSVVSRKGQEKTLTRWWAWLEGLAWSPHGDEIWFTGADAGGAKVLYAVSIAGKLRVVLRSAGSVVLNDIGRDGQVLLSRSDFRVEAHGSIDGEKPERDLSWLDQTWATDLSPDGRTLLIPDEGEGSGPHYTTYLRKTDGSPAVRLFDGLGMTLSPDGKWALAVPTNRKPPLALQPTGPGTARFLERGPIETYDWASWFPDGKRIVISGVERGGVSRCYVQDLSGGAPRAVTPPGTSLYNPGAAVSPDGRFILSRHADGSAYLYPVGGGTARRVSGITPSEYAIRWSADGQSLYLALTVRGFIYRLDVGTGKKQLWIAPAPVDSAGMRLIAPVLISADGKSYVYSMWRELSDLYLVKGLR